MTSFPADPSAAAVDKLAAKLEGRDPFAVQDELLDALERLIARVDDAALRRPEAPGKWSIIEVLQHLADTELAYGWRLRMILAHDNPALEGFDQDAWARALAYRAADPDDALNQLRALRAANLRLYRNAGESGLDRAGVHAEAGPMSARRILYTLAVHDLVHRRQIERIKAAPRP